MAAYLTFDIGTTALKTALISDEGRITAIHASEYAFRTPLPDRAEMPSQVYWEAAVEGTGSVLKESGADPATITSIGFSSQGETFVPLDPSGRPLRDAIVWVDNRAQGIVDEWERDWLTRDNYREISGYPWLPAGLTVFKLAWLQRNAPEAHNAWKFLCLPDYLIYRMTGETVTDRTTAQFSGLYDLQTGDWEPRLLEAAGVSRDQLPTILEPGSVAGRLRADAARELGLVSGTPVCVGANDQIAGAVGAGNVRPGIMSETTGTALALVATTSDLLVDTRMCVGRHAVDGLFFAMPFTITSAIVLKWLKDLCGGREEYGAFLEGVEAVPPGCDGLTVLPHFAGTASPTFNPEARGAFVGLTLAHTRDHLARAVMESCACMLQECIGIVRDHSADITTVRSLGGAARNDLWLQMKADMLGVPVERPECSDAASLGAAVMAAVGAGQFAGITEGADRWYRPSRVFEPDSGLYARYQEIHNRYLSLYNTLYGEGANDVLPVS